MYSMHSQNPAEERDATITGRECHFKERKVDMAYEF
jgi:hypothetical protein